MALITVGSVEDFAIAPEASFRREQPLARGIASARVLREVSADIPTAAFRYSVSSGPRGMALANLRLEKQALKFFTRLFERRCNIYFLAWAWDLSGEPIYSYPGSSVGVGYALIPMKGNELREFLGAGVLLFPSRPVTSGLQLRIQVWQSRKGVRTFGAAMAAVGQAIAESELNAVLNAGSLVAGHVGVTIAAAKEGALLLTRSIGTILKSYGDDVLDLYEGNYPANATWKPGHESHAGYGTKIVLSRLV